MTATERKTYGDLTEDQKEIARSASKTYAKKMKQVTVRIPADQADAIITKAKERAKALGITAKNGEGSLNGYILALIANDLNIDIKTISEIDR